MTPGCGKRGTDSTTFIKTPLPRWRKARKTCRFLYEACLESNTKKLKTSPSLLLFLICLHSFPKKIFQKKKPSSVYTRFVFF